MMYHFMLGLRGGSAAPAAAPSPPLARVSFFSSSCISCSTLVDCTTCDPSQIRRPSSRNSATAEIMKHPINTVPDHKIHGPEIRCEQKNRDNDHDRSGLHFLERGRGHLFHLGAHVVVESLDPLGPGLDPVAETIAGSYH